MANLAFALTVDPTNFDLINYYNRVKNMRENNLPSLPSSIGNEKQINPFLRTDTSEIMQSVSQYSNLPESNAIETFIRLRKWKDTF